MQGDAEAAALPAAFPEVLAGPSVIALTEWPRAGVPINPGVWLMAVAKRRAVDALRRDKMRECRRRWLIDGG